MTVHVWTRYVEPSWTWESVCRRRFPGKAEKVPVERDADALERATCLDCLRSLRDRSLREASSWAAVAASVQRVITREEHRRARGRRA